MAQQALAVLPDEVRNKHPDVEFDEEYLASCYAKYGDWDKAIHYYCFGEDFELFTPAMENGDYTFLANNGLAPTPTKNEKDKVTPDNLPEKLVELPPVRTQLQREPEERSHTPLSLEPELFGSQPRLEKHSIVPKRTRRVQPKPKPTNFLQLDTAERNTHIQTQQLNVIQKKLEEGYRAWLYTKLSFCTADEIQGFITHVNQKRRGNARITDKMSSWDMTTIKTALSGKVFEHLGFKEYLRSKPGSTPDGNAYKDFIDCTRTRNDNHHDSVKHSQLDILQAYTKAAYALNGVLDSEDSGSNFFLQGIKRLLLDSQQEGTLKQFTFHGIKPGKISVKVPTAGSVKDIKAMLREGFGGLDGDFSFRDENGAYIISTQHFEELRENDDIFIVREEQKRGAPDTPSNYPNKRIRVEKTFI